MEIADFPYGNYESEKISIYGMASSKKASFWRISFFKKYGMSQTDWSQDGVPHMCRTSKLVKMLSESQTAWIWVKQRVTRCLIQIQAVYIWNYSCVWQAKG